ncbi:unnamed protein product [Tuber melanosporum]|uniref:(Perigord truffle) hypothetical protein n=1 Tax=Tuber melanosporum (strain Mel28) TaxID=656061 RepID=D5GIK9_TUBMM|nr:uncharacterized protein GSTUM_00008544001 [Tuber melanosporum]CAZ84352.1 unnamed protein product [Tuber melanosporum]
MLSSISSTEIANTFGRPACTREFPSIFLYFLFDNYLPPGPYTQRKSLHRGYFFSPILRSFVNAMRLTGQALDLTSERSALYWTSRWNTQGHQLRGIRPDSQTAIGGVVGAASASAKRVSTKSSTYFYHSGRMGIQSGLYPCLSQQSTPATAAGESWAGVQHSRPPFGFRRGSCFSRLTKPYCSPGLFLQFLPRGLENIIVNERLVRLIPLTPK